MIWFESKGASDLPSERRSGGLEHVRNRLSDELLRDLQITFRTSVERI